MKTSTKMYSIAFASISWILLLRPSKSDTVKMGIILTAASLFLLFVSSPVLAALPDVQVGPNNNHLGELGISYDHSSYIAPKSNLPFAGSYRIGLVSGNVAEYKIKVNVGPGEYDNITLTNYVREIRPWHTYDNRNLIILPGQALTEKFYSSMAIYFAKQGYSTYVLDRRETNILPTETDFSFMKSWTVDEQLNDTYKSIVASRNHTSFLSGKPVNSIKASAIGHSHGALLLTAYKASKYADLPLGSVNKIVPVDIIIKYDPKNSELIQGQAEEFNIFSKSIEDGTYQDSHMTLMLGAASLAVSDPDGNSSMPGITNIQLFRLLASQTYMFSQHPYTPDYHYWSGNLSGLYYVNESKVLNTALAGGAVPYAPMYTDQYMAGLMGNVDGYEIDSSKIDCPVLYVGLGGGFGDYGSWWYKEVVGKTNNNVTTMNWKSQGHASILIDYNSANLWSKINMWLSTRTGP